VSAAPRSNNNEVEYVLNVNVDQALTQSKKLEAQLVRILHYASRLSGGNEDLNATINIIAQMITTAKAAQTALIALQAARMASGDPTAWLSFGLAAVGTGFAGYDMLTTMTGA
jgi:hypothetical protein